MPEEPGNGTETDQVRDPDTTRQKAKPPGKPVGSAMNRGGDSFRHHVDGRYPWLPSGSALADVAGLEASLRLQGLPRVALSLSLSACERREGGRRRALPPGLTVRPADFLRVAFLARLVAEDPQPAVAVAGEHDRL